LLLRLGRGWGRRRRGDLSRVSGCDDESELGSRHIGIEIAHPACLVCSLDYTTHPEDRFVFCAVEAPDFPPMFVFSRCRVFAVSVRVTACHVEAFNASNCA